MLSLSRQNYWREQYRAKHPGWQPATELFADHVRRNLRLNSRLLDLGCGRGGLIEQLGHPLNQSIGIDPDFFSLREHRLAALPRASASSSDIPLADNSIDIVIASWLLEHLVSPSDTLKAVHRVLRPNGLFIFVTPNRLHPLGWINRFAGQLGYLQGHLVDRLYGRAEGDTFPTTYRANSPQALTELAIESGFIITHLETVADPSYLAFNKPLFRAMCFIDEHLPPSRHIHLVGAFQKST